MFVDRLKAGLLAAALGASCGSPATPTNVASAVAVTCTQLSLTPGQTAQCSAQLRFSDGSTSDATGSASWTSSTPSVATVSAAGSVTAVAPGNATITAATNGVSGSQGVSVNAPVATSVTVSSALPTYSGAYAVNAVGTKATFTATARLSTGTTQDVSSLATWTSSTAGVAASSGGGSFTATGAGATSITASYAGASGSVPLKVVPVANISLVSSVASGVALQSLTSVRLSISGLASSLDDGSTYSWSVDPGDGTSGPSENVGFQRLTYAHTYQRPNLPFTARATVTDLFGRLASATVAVSVRSMNGRWTSIYQNPSNRLRETRYLDLVQENGTTALTGVYTHTDGTKDTLTGRIRGEATVELTLNNGLISFAGNDLDDMGVSLTDANSMIVIMKGGSADGATLTFTR